jgi:hypothetical protein
MPRQVVTVHGIDSDGNWQERVEAVLAPHFECIGIKYTNYRRFGALRLSFGSVGLVCLAIILLFCFAFQAVSGNVVAALALMAAASLVAAFGFLLARWRRSNTLRQFKEQLDQRVEFAGCPHLIAHSFGTFLAGNAVMKFPSLKLIV